MEEKKERKRIEILSERKEWKRERNKGWKNGERHERRRIEIQNKRKEWKRKRNRRMEE
jgi:hypothetical protein